MPPSTTASQTTSAALRPVCGRASTEFSILTASAGRWTSVAVSTPVSGHSTGSGTGGGTGGGVGSGVDGGVLEGVVATASGTDEAQPAAATSTAATSSAAPRRPGDVDTLPPPAADRVGPHGSSPDER